MCVCVVDQVSSVCVCLKWHKKYCSCLQASVSTSNCHHQLAITEGDQLTCRCKACSPCLQTVQMTAAGCTCTSWCMCRCVFGSCVCVSSLCACVCLCMHELSTLSSKASVHLVSCTPYMSDNKCCCNTSRLHNCRVSQTQHCTQNLPLSC